MLLGGVLCYFLVADFQQLVDEAIRILTSDDEAKVKEWVSGFGAWGPVFIVTAMVAQMFRVSPFLSNDAISFVTGIGEMRYPKFILATAGGIIPLIAAIAYVGQDTETLEKSMLWVTGATVVGFAAYLIYRRAKK